MADDAMPPAGPVAQTRAGRVRGAIVEGIAAFKTIPYGATTAGAARFLPPRPPTPWDGERDATAYSGHAPQAGLRAATRPELADLYGAADSSPETEDCLTVNVWTPAVDHGGRPVMVWFHGGAFSFGTGDGERVRGTRLCRRGDVVVVSVNQRLNILGFLDLSEIGGREYAQSGNAGTLDMLAALHWVRDNIAAFGGDPANVTIFGESGGGGKVCTLMAMPAARGLFHKAIVQSGACVRLREPARARRLTELVLRELGITAEPIARLREVPAARLLAAIAPAQLGLGAAAQPLFDRYPFGPSVDGTVVAQHPFDPGASDIAADVPLLIGDMKDEQASFLATDDEVWFRTLSEAELLSRVAAVAGTAAGSVVDAYHHAFPTMTPAELLIAILTDAQFRIRSLTVADRKVRQGGAPVFMYAFEWETPVCDGRLKAAHALDVPFTFDTIDLTRAADGRADAARLAGIMAETWIEFARTGRPAHRDLPDWPAYDSKTRPTMVLDSVCRLDRDPRASGRRIWQELAGG